MDGQSILQLQNNFGQFKDMDAEHNSADHDLQHHKFKWHIDKLIMIPLETSNVCTKAVNNATSIANDLFSEIVLFSISDAI